MRNTIVGSMLVSAIKYFIEHWVSAGVSNVNANVVSVFKRPEVTAS